MKKSDIALQYEKSCNSMFASAAIALSTQAVVSIILSSSGIPAAINLLLNAFSAAFVLFAFIMTVKGFATLDKACRLSEENECYYMGRNLKRGSIVCFVFMAIFWLVAAVFSLLLQQYDKAQMLTDADMIAVNNIRTLTAVVLMGYQISAIATPFIFYLWKIHKYTDKKDKINNFALLTMFIFVVQLVIGLMNTGYSLKTPSKFLNGFAAALMVVKYIVLFVFFMVRKKGFEYVVADEPAENGEDAEDAAE